MKYYAVKPIAKSWVRLVRQFYIERLLSNFSEYIHGEKL